MRNPRLFGILGVLLGLVGISVVVLAGPPRSKAGRSGAVIRQLERPVPQPKMTAGQWEAVGGYAPSIHAAPDEPAPTQALKVLPSNKVEAGPLKVQTNVASLMNAAKLGVPDHRAAHFRWLNAPNHRVTGWTGFIEGVDPIDGGLLVTVRINPSIQFNGTSATTFDCSIERYSIIDGQVRFVEGIDPPLSSPGVHVTD